MADTDKKDFEAKLDADPRDEMTKASKDYIDGDKDLKKLVTNFKFSEKVELDKRKWSKASLADGVLAVARYEMKIFATAIGDMAKKQTPAKEAGPRIKTLHAKLQKEINKKLSLAVEELANDKGDNKKSLKDCKAAFDKLARVEFSMMYQAPREEAEEAFKRLADVMKDKRASDDEKMKEISEALKTVDVCIDQFDDSGKQASLAIDTLLKAAKTTKANKDVDSELNAFAESISKNESKITSILGNSKKFADALAAAQKILKSGNVTEQVAKVQSSLFAKMSSFDKSAKSTLKELSRLEPAFKKIEKKLK